MRVERAEEESPASEREGEKEDGEGNDSRANEAGESSGIPQNGEREKVALLNQVGDSDEESSSVYYTGKELEGEKGNEEEDQGNEGEGVEGDESEGKHREDAERAKWKLAQLNKKRDVYESDEES